MLKQSPIVVQFFRRNDPSNRGRYTSSVYFDSYEEAEAIASLAQQKIQYQGYVNVEEYTTAHMFDYDPDVRQENVVLFDRMTVFSYYDGRESVVPPQYRNIRSVQKFLIHSNMGIPKITLHRGKCKLCGTRQLREAGNSSLCARCLRKHGYGHARGRYERRYSAYGGESPSWGIELEMVLEDSGNKDAEKRYQNVLERAICAGYLRTADGTVDDEMVSPIYHLPYVPGNLKKLFNDASEFTQSERVGSHLNIGGLRHFSALNNEILSLIRPLEEYLALHRSQTIAIWGRYFGEYRLYHTNGCHGDWLATYHDRIEFRLARLTSYAQYARLTKWLIGMLEQTSIDIMVPHRNVDIGERIVDSYVSTFGESRKDGSITQARNGETRYHDDDDDDDYRHDDDEDEDEDDNSHEASGFHYCNTCNGWHE